MARIKATADEVELEGDHGMVAGLEVTCGKCGHTVEVFGTSDASERRGGVMLAEDCPRKERNFYVVYAPGESDASPIEYPIKPKKRSLLAP